MALYEYLCDGCGVRFEKRMPMAEVQELVGCPKCGKRARKLMANFAVTGRAEESVDLDFEPPDPRELPNIAGADQRGDDHSHDHGHGHSHGHSHGHGSGNLDT